MLQIVFLVSLESSWWEGGSMGLGSMMFGLAVQKTLNIEWSLLSWIFQRNWNVPLVLLRRFGWAGFNGIYLVKIWIQNVGDIDFEVISAAENSNKFQKTRFWKEKSVENVVTLEGLLFNSSMISFHVWLFKKSIHTLQNNVHMSSFSIL